MAALGCLLALVALCPTVAVGDGGLPELRELAPGAVATMDVTTRIASLKDAPEIVAPAWPQGVEVNRPTLGLSAYRAAKAAAAGAPKEQRPTASAPKPDAPGPLASTTVVSAFTGPTQGGAGGSFVPPDSNGATSPGAPLSNQSVTIVNSKLNVFDKDTGTPRLEKSLNTLFGDTTRSFFDPRIEYDQIADRWLAVAETIPESTTVQRVFAAVSNTSDATGGWCVFSADVDYLDNNDFLDYLQLGQQQDAVVLTGNVFPAGGGYAGANAIGWPKRRLYACKAFSFNIFPALPGTTTPSEVLDGNPRMHLVTQTTFNVVQNVTYKNPGNLNYSSISVAPITIDPYGFPPNAPQPGTCPAGVPSCLLDTGDGRFVNNQTQYGDHLWATHTTNDFGRATPRLYDFDTEGDGANTIRCSTDFFLTGSSYDFNASVAAHQDGRVYLNWSLTDPAAPTALSQAVGAHLPAPGCALTPAVRAFTSAAPLSGSYHAGFGAQRFGDTSSLRFETETGIVASAFNEVTGPFSGATTLWQMVRTRFFASS